MLRQAPETKLNVDLATRFGLTPAEVGLALAVANETSLHVYAEARTLSIHTVRNQLKAIYTNTDTQSQLAAVVLAPEGVPASRI